MESKEINNKHCSICNFQTETFLNCPTCVNCWCCKCDEKIDKCPFCRGEIPLSKIKIINQYIDFFSKQIVYLSEQIIYYEKMNNRYYDKIESNYVSQTMVKNNIKELNKDEITHNILNDYFDNINSQIKNRDIIQCNHSTIEYFKTSIHIFHLHRKNLKMMKIYYNNILKNERILCQKREQLNKIIEEKKNDTLISENILKKIMTITKRDLNLKRNKNNFEKSYKNFISSFQI